MNPTTSVSPDPLASFRAWEPVAVVPTYLTPFGVHDAADVAQIVYRSDTGKAVGSVGPLWTAVRKADIADLFSELANRGHLTNLRCGEFGGGSRVFIQGDPAKGDIDIVPGLTLRNKLTFLDAYDGSLSLALVDTAVMVVCQNTYHRAHRTGRGTRLRHTASIRERVADLILAIKASADAHEKSAAVFRAMASKTIDHSAWKALLDEHFPMPAAGKEPVAADVDARNRLSWALEYSPGARPGTALGAYQAFTYWLTHERGRSANRLESNLTGEAARMNRSVLATLVASLN